MLSYNKNKNKHSYHIKLLKLVLFGKNTNTIVKI